MKAVIASLLVTRSANVEAAVAFYRALGLEFVAEQHGAGPLHYACALGDFVFEIYPLKSGAPNANDSTMLGFRVASIDQTLATLRALDIAPHSPPKLADWGRFVNVTDTDGRAVQLTENVGALGD